MIRTIQILAFVVLVLAACSPKAAPFAPTAPPRNLVCERVALKDPTAKCVPEMTDAGDLHTHSARVTLKAQTTDGNIVEETLACSLNAAQVGVVCGEPFYAPKPEKVAPPPGPSAPPAEAKTDEPKKSEPPAKAPKK